MKNALFILVLLFSTSIYESKNARAQVVADIAPIYSLVARVMHGTGAPKLLVQHGASPHSYSMRPSEAKALYQSKVIFWSGKVLNRQLSRSLENVSETVLVIDLSSSKDITRLPMRKGATFDEHDEHDEYDPHLWLDPSIAKVWIDIITKNLSSTFPKNGAIYEENAKLAKEEINASVMRTKTLFKTSQSLNFIVFHDAYQYFENYYGISALGSIMLANAAKPSPARLIEIKNKINELGVNCIFSEPQFNSGLINAIASNTKISVKILDPFGSSLSLDKDLYIGIIDQMTSAINSCK